MGYFSELHAETQGYPGSVGHPYEEELFIVVGCTGEYEEYREWNVTAFSKHTDAKEYVDLLDRIVTTHNKNSLAEYEEDIVIEGKLLPYDPKAQVEGYIHYKIDRISLRS